MAKFGLMSVNEPSKSVQEFEGEFLEINGDVVSVVANVSTNYRTVAVVRLHPGQVVKKLDK